MYNYVQWDNYDVATCALYSMLVQCITKQIIIFVENSLTLWLCIGSKRVDLMTFWLWLTVLFNFDKNGEEECDKTFFSGLGTRLHCTNLSLSLDLHVVHKDAFSHLFLYLVNSPKQRLQTFEVWNLSMLTASNHLLNMFLIPTVGTGVKPSCWLLEDYSLQSRLCRAGCTCSLFCCHCCSFCNRNSTLST